MDQDSVIQGYGFNQEFAELLGKSAPTAHHAIKKNTHPELLAEHIAERKQRLAWMLQFQGCNVEGLRLFATQFGVSYRIFREYAYGFRLPSKESYLSFRQWFESQNGQALLNQYAKW